MSDKQEPMRMVLGFPPDSPQIIREIKIVNSTDEYVLGFSEDTVISFTIRTPNGDFRYIIDNVNKTFTTESDKPFLV